MCLGIEPSLAICLGSSSWARTNDTAVNSRMLYLLSYEGICKIKICKTPGFPILHLGQLFEKSITSFLFVAPNNSHGYFIAHRLLLQLLTSLKHRTITTSFTMVRVTGLEPVRCHHRGILSPLRLPIPPHPHIK